MRGSAGRFFDRFVVGTGGGGGGGSRAASMGGRGDRSELSTASRRSDAGGLWDFERRAHAKRRRAGHLRCHELGIILGELGDDRFVRLVGRNVRRGLDDLRRALGDTNATCFGPGTADALAREAQPNARAPRRSATRWQNLMNEKLERPIKIRPTAVIPTRNEPISEKSPRISSPNTKPTLPPPGIIPNARSVRHRDVHQRREHDRDHEIAGDAEPDRADAAASEERQPHQSELDRDEPRHQSERAHEHPRKQRADRPDPVGAAHRRVVGVDAEAPESQAKEASHREKQQRGRFSASPK